MPAFGSENDDLELENENENCSEQLATPQIPQQPSFALPMAIVPSSKPPSGLGSLKILPPPLQEISPPKPPVVPIDLSISTPHETSLLVSSSVTAVVESAGEQGVEMGPVRDGVCETEHKIDTKLGHLDTHQDLETASPPCCISTQTDPHPQLSLSPRSAGLLTDAVPPNWTDSHEHFRILLIFANPSNTHPLRLQTEEKSIREALQRGDCGKHITVDVLLACTVDDLARQLLDHSYEVIHFSGHADRSASLFRHTMKALHVSHDVDLASLKRPAVIKQVEAAVEALALRFESSLLSSPAVPPTGSSSSSSSTTTDSAGDSDSSNSHRLHYCSVPTAAGSTTPPSTQFSVTSTQHRGRVEKDIHHMHHKVSCPRQHLAHTSTGPALHGWCSSVITPAAVASHLLVKEVEVGLEVGDECPPPDQTPPLHAPHGSARVQFSESEHNNSHTNTANHHKHLQHELHIPKLTVTRRSSPSEEFEIDFKKTFTYQDIMDIGVGSLAFESESHDASSGISFVSPPSLALLLAEHGGPSLQCVLLNVCGGHIQGDLLSSIVPFTVCFTGKVADKESLAFSKGFYDSIARGQSVLQAFRVGSGRMDLHKLAPGVPDRLSSLPPLLTLLKNQRLLEKSLLAVGANKTLLLQQQQQRLRVEDATSSREREELEALNQKYLKENNELRSLIAYGMELMKGKDAELKAMRQALDFVSQAAGLGNTGSKKLGNGGKKSTPSSVHVSRSNSGKTTSVSAASSTKKKFVNVKSSGYGRRNAKNSTGPGPDEARKPNFIKRNKALILKSKNKKEASSSSHDQADAQAKTAFAFLPSTSSSVAAIVKKEKEDEANWEKADIAAASAKKSKNHLPPSASAQSTTRTAGNHGAPKPGLQKRTSSMRTPLGLAAKHVATHSHLPATAPPLAPPCPLPLSPPNKPDPDAITSSILVCEGDRKRSTAQSSRKSSSKMEQRAAGPPSPYAQSKARGSPSRPKQTSTIASPKNTAARGDVQKAFPTTIALVKPKAWVKYYISDGSSNTDPAPRSRSVLGNGDSFDDGTLGRNTHSPPPSRSKKAKSSLSQSQPLPNERSGGRRSRSLSSSGGSSSQGWRKFLEERRAERKPSSSFASSVPRFEAAGSVSSGGGKPSGSTACTDAPPPPIS
eukprot:CAMPEP_0114434378 /NCGR_PEP_ID=MMETSP0103-20121206/12231_1 /TAXON_ID=37642 ORGANISM="Paraphysomonas imperforata, Strain PA2" /NCGR_SAMPLE_ID=MMETSP0103 /ASSEMBLY_ACC=CAM_ASM_000201 /LENGTH=1144 /DNA_ID=CAMNT_0001604265 /DNA_START=185 /DNA_END=3619 /DNA_ORIENTATION=-